MHPRPQEPTGDLGPRLRALRQSWPDVRITQSLLAGAFRASPTLISSWENSTALPPPERLRQYATLFATARSAADGRLALLPDGDLTPDEAAARDRLYEELLDLRAAGEDPTGAAPGRRHSTWSFPDGEPVRLICGRVGPESAGAYADPAHPNYTQLHAMADPDALIELFGHLRMLNPDSDVRFRLADDMTPDDLSTHVVLIGGMLQNPAARYFAHTGRLPVQQVQDPRFLNGEVFELRGDGEPTKFLPTFLEDDSTLGLIEDVGLFARMPNPVFTARTLTVCNGMYSRGVLGAVRMLTDARLRDRNEAFLADRFGGSPEFGLLLRVPVFRGEASTPDLGTDNHRLYEWPPADPG